MSGPGWLIVLCVVMGRMAIDSHFVTKLEDAGGGGGGDKIKSTVDVFSEKVQILFCPARRG